MALIGTGTSVIGNTSFGQSNATLQQQLNQPISRSPSTTSVSIQSVQGVQGSTGYAGVSISAARSSQGLTAGGTGFIDYSSASASAAIVNDFGAKRVDTGTNNFSTPSQLTASKSQLPPAGSEAAANDSTTNIAGDSGQREVTCSICGGQILSKTSGRLMFYLNLWLQRFASIVVPIGVILDFLKERAPVSKTTALTVCGACENKRQIKDPSDDREKYAQAAAIAQSLAPQIEQAEAQLQPPGGNRYTVIAGHEVLEVGLGMNTAPSYRVDYNKGFRNKGIATSTKSSTDSATGKKTGEANPRYSFIASSGGTANHVQGLNPPAIPGGSYTIKCSNRMNIVTGAQGIDLTTGGPVNITGGITKITGPEVSVGSSTGRLLLGGDTINMEAKSIEMAPTDGHVYTRGTMSCSGNCIVGGHTHSESASIVKLATTGKNDDTKASSSSNVYGGPAFWGGPIYEGIYAALRELLSHVTVNTTQPVLLKEVGPLSFRYVQTLIDNSLNLAYILRPIELVPTGIVVDIGGIGFVFNFPHVHAMPDQPHSHGYRGPDIDYSAETAEQLRGTAAAGADGPAPLHKKSTSLIDVTVALWSIISAAWVAAGKAILENNYVK
jgi:hypothetical protein